MLRATHVMQLWLSAGPDSQAAELTLVHGFAHFAYPVTVIPHPTADGV